jgi:hypothetical protein
MLDDDRNCFCKYIYTMYVNLQCNNVEWAHSTLGIYFIYLQQHKHQANGKISINRMRCICIYCSLIFLWDKNAVPLLRNYGSSEQGLYRTDLIITSSQEGVAVVRRGQRALRCAWGDHSWFDAIVALPLWGNPSYLIASLCSRDKKTAPGTTN